MTEFAKDLLVWAVLAAGVAQAILCLATPAIPVVLGWRGKLAVLPKLMRQVYWTYACYIFGAHICFAVASLVVPHWLLRGDGPAALITGFIALWWGVRLVLHLVQFDTSEVPEGPWYRAAEWALGLLFAFLTVVYVWAFVFNVGGGVR